MVRLALVDEEVDPPDGTSPTGDGDRPNPNLNRFTAALSCYPIVSQLASNLDLTALHELSRTCRQVRANLLQYRTQLIAQTLRCENESGHPTCRFGHPLQANNAVWVVYGRDGVSMGACVHDMVGECRRCGKVVCRNCVTKAPPTSTLKGRHRRLCRTCMKCPVEQLTTVVNPKRHHPPHPTRISPDPLDPPAAHATPTPIARDPCTCATAGVWLCIPCGAASRGADTTYLRGWTWRTRYSACGGFGAGLGEGNEGVECGRMRACRAARTVEKDVECRGSGDAAIAADGDDDDDDRDRDRPATARGRCWEGGGYAAQEIVGIGGKVKKKLRQRVPVGAVVKEYEDERATEVFLGREQSGVNRSWCSWCERVVLGKKDVDGTAAGRESVGSAVSTASTV